MGSVVKIEKARRFYSARAFTRSIKFVLIFVFQNDAGDDKNDADQCQQRRADRIFSDRSDDFRAALRSRRTITGKNQKRDPKEAGARNQQNSSDLRFVGSRLFISIFIFGIRGKGNRNLRKFSSAALGAFRELI